MLCAIPLLALLMTVPTPSALPPGPRVEQVLTNELRSRFDRLTSNSEAYRKRVLEECSVFPEGDLFPYLFPIYAYTNLAMQEPAQREELSSRVRTLLELAIPVVAERVRAPGHSLLRMKEYGQHATYVCQLNVALGAARLLGEQRYDALHVHLTQVIRRALEQAKGAPLHSFPGLIWPFDTVPCLFSLALYERGTGQDVNAGTLSKTHFDWTASHGLDEGTSLPCSQMNEKQRCTTVPRGCDLSFRLMMLFQFAPVEARTLYDGYVAHFWRERLVAAGFGEWPDGGPAREDVDSGPILMDIGTAATALGIGAVKAAGDLPRFARLVSQTETAKEMLRNMTSSANGSALLGGLIELSNGYTSGFLYGDAVLFWALTWSKWRKLST